MLMQYNQSLQGTQTIPSIKSSLENRTVSHEANPKVKKTVYTVKPIMVPVTAIEPRKLSKTQKQWCQYNNMIFNYPEKPLPEGNLVPSTLGDFSKPINEDGREGGGPAKPMPHDYELVKQMLEKSNLTDEVFQEQQIRHLFSTVGDTKGAH
jgi:hypothetical protein